MIIHLSVEGVTEADIDASEGSSQVHLYRYLPTTICRDANLGVTSIYTYDMIWISITISLKFALEGPVNNIPASV